MDETFVMLKPDCVRRKLIGEVISRIEAKGLSIEEMQLLVVSREVAESHYAEHRGKDFFDSLIGYITSAPVVIMRVTGLKAVESMRQLCGATDPVVSLPGTIRGDLGNNISENLIHSSDSPASAARELELFFGSTIIE